MIRRTLPWTVLATALVVFASPGPSARAEDKVAVPPAFKQPAPKGEDDLEVMQEHLAKIAEKVKPSVVAIQIGAGTGSGVIVKDGYVLTAAHVSGKADQECVLILHDGKRIKGKTLGGNSTIDSGLVKILEKGDFPAVEMGKYADVQVGQWAFVSAHPGGYKPNRPPVIRLGRVLSKRATVFSTSCIVVNGDSGGPVFDMDGRVIGINSRIGPTLSMNMHVPINTYEETWDRLAKGEVWGSGAFGPGGLPGGPGAKPAAGAAFLGLGFDPNAQDCTIGQVSPNSPAEKAGLMAQDVITSVDGNKVGTGLEVAGIVRKSKPGDTLKFEVQRGADKLKIDVVLSKAGGGAPDVPQKKAGAPFLGLGVAPEGEDCTVAHVAEGSPAEKAGLKVDDVITQIDGRKVSSGPDLAQRIGAMRPGDTVQLLVRRGDETLKLKVVLGTK